MNSICTDQGPEVKTGQSHPDTDGFVSRKSPSGKSHGDDARHKSHSEDATNESHSDDSGYGSRNRDFRGKPHGVDDCEDRKISPSIEKVLSSVENKSGSEIATPVSSLSKAPQLRVNLEKFQEIPTALIERISRTVVEPVLRELAGAVPPMNSETADEHVEEWLKALFDEFAVENLLDIFEDWQYANMLPPITAQALQELETKKVIANPFIRRDINFVTTMNLRPRIGKEQSEKKNEESTKYWNAIAAELELYRILNGLSLSRRLTLHKQGINLKRIVDASAKRLPIMFGEIRKILKLLLPVNEHALIEEGLRDDVILPKIQRNAYDIKPTVKWLSKILKTHCAPAHVEPVEDLAELLQKQNPSTSANALCQLFEIFEAMKLDITNHEVALLRCSLIQGTITFLYDFFEKAIKDGVVKVDEDVEWIKDHHDAIKACSPNRDTEGFKALTPPEVFVHAFVDLMIPSIAWKPIPTSFRVSTTRIMLLRQIILQRIFINLSYQVYEECHHYATKGAIPISDATKKEVQRKFGLIFDRRSVTKVLPNIAVQISADIQALGVMEDIDQITIMSEKIKPVLEARFRRDSPEFAAKRNEFQRHLYSEVAALCRSFMRASCLEMSQKLVPDTLSTPEYSRPPASRVPSRYPKLPKHLSRIQTYCNYLDADLVDVAKAVSHIAILHYQVWGPLIYHQAISERRNISHTNMTSANLQSSNSHSTDES